MNLEKPTTCEDSLTFLLSSNVAVKEDRGILSSISRQLNKKTALTDRQYALVKTKLLTYKRFWQSNKIDIDTVINNLKYPLREIDRSHWLKILNYNDQDILGIRFPFNKKVIDRIEDLRRMSSDEKSPLKYKDNTHYFNFTPKNIFGLVGIAERFNTKFTIHQEILDVYNQLLEYEANKDDYIPGVYNNEVRNIPEIAVKNLEQEIGKCDYDTLALYFDRRFLYSFSHFDNADVDYSTKKYSIQAQNIIKRKQSTHFVDSKTTNINDLISAIIEVKRLPILIVLEQEHAHDMLVKMHNAFKYIIPENQMSVLFRKDGEDPFNDYVKNQKLNNLVDKDTKIVYINNNKLPKPLLSCIAKNIWMPRCSLLFNGTRAGFRVNHVGGYIENMDLRIVYDDVQTGLWDRVERKYISANL